MLKYGLTLIASILAIWVGIVPANAAYPDRPVMIVIGFPAGGYIDSLSRLAAGKLGEQLGQQFIVLNRPGAGGNIATTSVRRAEPDGYTLMIHIVSSMATYSVLRAGGEEREMPNFAVAAVVASTPGLMSSGPKVTARDFKSFLEAIRAAAPNSNDYASPGIGTPSYFWSREIISSMGLKVIHVPFAGGAESLQNVMAGRVSWTIDTPIGSFGMIEAKSVTPLAIIGPRRLTLLPDVPTIGEVGLPQLADRMSNIFLMAPGGTQDAIVQKLNDAFNKVMLDKEFSERIEQTGSLFPIGQHTPMHALEFAQNDYRIWFKMAEEDAKHN